MADKASQDYWKTRQAEYQAERDAIEDERFERQWAYKLETAASPKSSSSSRRKSGSSASKTSGVKSIAEQSSPEVTGQATAAEQAASAGISMAAKATYKILLEQVAKATDNGKKAADKAVKKEILKIAKESYLSQGLIDELDRALGKSSR